MTVKRPARPPPWRTSWPHGMSNWLAWNAKPGQRCAPPSGCARRRMRARLPASPPPSRTSRRMRRSCTPRSARSPPRTSTFPAHSPTGASSTNWPPPRPPPTSPLVQRDGRVSVYPLALRLEPRAQGVRIGRRLERRIRPSFLARHLRDTAAAPESLQRPPVPRSPVPRLYGFWPASRDPAWQPNRPGEGPLVPLADLHDLLTLLPAAAADYPLGRILARPSPPGPPAGRPHRPRPTLRAGRFDRHQGRQAPVRLRRDWCPA